VVGKDGKLNREKEKAVNKIGHGAHTVTACFLFKPLTLIPKQLCTNLTRPFVKSLWRTGRSVPLRKIFNFIMILSVSDSLTLTFVEVLCF
jgi:hypothetical protein